MFLFWLQWQQPVPIPNPNQLLRGGKQKTTTCVGMTVMAKTTIEEICENAKLARDMALTGNYDSACIYYEGLQVEYQEEYHLANTP